MAVRTDAAGSDGVGGVEPTAEAGFDDDDFRVLAAQPVEGEGGRVLEERGRGRPVGGEVAQMGQPFGDGGFGDGAAIEPDAFAETETRCGEV